MAQITFYGDESGTEDKSNVAVAGYLSTLGQWNQFKVLWQKALDKEGVEVFHRTDMEWPPHGEFRDWDKKRLKNALRRAHSIIKHNTIKGIGQAIKVKAFQEVMPRAIKETFGGAYGWAVQHCAVVLGRWATEHNHWITYIFESGANGRDEVDKALKSLYKDPRDRERYRILDWGFADKRGPSALIGLQAADFIAYEAYKQTDNQVINGVKRPYRQSARHLIRKQDTLNVYLDKEMLSWLAHASSNPEFMKWLGDTNTKAWRR